MDDPLELVVTAWSWLRAGGYEYWIDRVYCWIQVGKVVVQDAFVDMSVLLLLIFCGAGTLLQGDAVSMVFAG